MLKQIIGEEAEDAATADRPSLGVDVELMRKACNVKEKSAKDGLFRLKQLSALARLAARGRVAKAAVAAPNPGAATRPFAQWTTAHDQELLEAAHRHGVDEAPAAVLAAGAISKLAAAHLASAAASAAPGETAAPLSPSGGAPAGDPRAAAEAELKKRLASRILECLKHVPGPHSGGGGGGAPSAAAPGRLGKRLGKPPASSKPKKHHRGGGGGGSGGGSGGESDGDFRKKKSKHADPANGAGGAAAGPAAKFRPVKIDESLTLVHPGTHLPNLPAFRPRDGARGGGGGRLVYPVGYVSEVQFGGKRWRCEIVDSGGDGPCFRITCADGLWRPFKSSVSPSDVWRQVPCLLPTRHYPPCCRPGADARTRARAHTHTHTRAHALTHARALTHTHTHTRAHPSTSMTAFGASAGPRGEASLQLPPGRTV